MASVPISANPRAWLLLVHVAAVTHGDDDDHQPPLLHQREGIAARANSLFQAFNKAAPNLLVRPI